MGVLYERSTSATSFLNSLEPLSTDFSVTLLNEPLRLRSRSVYLPRKLVKTQGDKVISDDFIELSSLRKRTAFEDVLHNIVSVLAFAQFNRVFHEFRQDRDGLGDLSSVSCIKEHLYLFLRSVFENLLDNSTAIRMESQLFNLMSY